RRLDLREQAFPVERLERRARPRHDVHLVSSCSRLAEDPLQKTLGIGPPDLHLDAVFLVEGGDQHGDILRRYGRIERELLLALGSLHQPLLAVRPRIAGDLGDARRLCERARGGESARGRGGSKKEQMCWSRAEHPGLPLVDWRLAPTMAQFHWACQRE